MKLAISSAFERTLIYRIVTFVYSDGANVLLVHVAIRFMDSRCYSGCDHSSRFLINYHGCVFLHEYS